MKDIRYGEFRRSIRRTLILYALFPAMCMVLIVELIFYFAWNQGVCERNNQCNTQISQSLEDYIARFRSACEAASGWDLDGPEWDVPSISAQLYEVVGDMPCKADFFVLDSERQLIAASTRLLPQILSDPDRPACGIMRQMERGPGQSMVSFSRLDTKDSGNLELEVGQALYESGSIKGYLLFTIRGSDFLRSAGALPALLIITDRYGNIFVSNAYQFQDEMDNLDAKVMEAEEYLHFEDDVYSTVKDEVEDGKIVIYTLSSVQIIRTLFTLLTIILIFVFAVMVMTIFLSTDKIAASKTKIIDEVTRAFDCVREGNLNVPLNIKTGDEFEIIGDSYNVMLSEFDNLIQLNKEKTRQTVMAEIKHLESQFDAHFLYNTLEVIRVLIRIDPRRGERMIINLSSLLRYSVDNKKEEVTIMEDMEYTYHYLEILEARFKERFCYHINIHHDTEDCIIPKLLFQPIIENAVKYGFGDRETLTVMVTSRIMEGDLVIAIYNDGVGMEKEALRRLTDSLEESSNPENKLGLYNIHRRIHLMYGPDYGLEIRSEMESGTVVKIRLPVHR